MSASLDDWAVFLTESFPRQDKFVQGLLGHVQTLSSRGLPPVFNNRHLRDLLGFSGSEFGSILVDRPHRYREFAIDKRQGGHRIISTPIPALYFAQRWVLDYIASQGVIHDAAHGGVPEKSIVTNAAAHLGQESILKVDIEDFYGNIGFGKGMAFFTGLGYSQEVGLSLSRICFKDGRLPQGAPTSPQLANVTSFLMDVRLSKLAGKYGLRYTRYFDDITFSGPHINLKLVKIISEIIRDSRFSLNSAKTRLLRGRSSKYVTGILINGDRLRLPKASRRRFRNQAILLLKHGVEAQADKGEKDPLVAEKTLGQLAFWKQVEPDNDVAKELFEKVLELGRKSSNPSQLPEGYRPKAIPTLDPAPNPT